MGLMGGRDQVPERDASLEVDGHCRDFSGLTMQTSDWCNKALYGIRKNSLVSLENWSLEDQTSVQQVESWERGC